MRATSELHSNIAGRDVRPLQLGADDVKDYAELVKLGLDVGSPRVLREMMTGLGAQGMDAVPNVNPTLFSASMAAPVQFLQAWLPGWVAAMTQARVIDEIVGVQTVGSWEDEEVVQGVMEPTGLARLYGDYTNVPLSSWNISYERRTIVRFEEGMRVGILEDARSAKANIRNAALKRAAAGLALDIQRNRVGFYGFNGGANRTYGLLNDLALPAYVNVPNGASASPLWSSKTFQEITADIRNAVGRLVVQAGGIVRVAGGNATKLTLALPLGVDNFLSVTSDFGVSVADWLAKTYPGIRVVTAPELTGANGGVNVFYIFADRVEDGASDDGGQTVTQPVPTRFKTLGVDRDAKSYVEVYSNATAGVMTKRPYLVVRTSGI